MVARGASSKIYSILFPKDTSFALCQFSNRSFDPVGDSHLFLFPIVLKSHLFNGHNIYGQYLLLYFW